MATIGVVIVAYNAATTLARVLDRIPPEFRGRIDGLFIGDNHSEDSTFLVGLGYKTLDNDFPVTVVRHPRNLGYGGNQKAGYQWAMEQGFDIVVLLHADGQYAPEFLPQIVAPLERGECDAVFGSRMMNRGDALRGGMPLYKYVGNIVLSRIENAVAGMNLTEWHSGYRAYSVAALRDLPLDRAADGFDFDSQIILQLKEAKKSITELAIPTFYGDEISHVAGMAYARRCFMHVLRYRAQKMGFGRGDMVFETPDADLDETDERVQSRILESLRNRPPARILDLGCGDARLARRLRSLGHHVTGVDVIKPDEPDSLDDFVEADLDQGIPAGVGRDFDCVLLVDVVAHLRDPGALLREAAEHLTPGGSITVSVPNFGHWYPRTRVALGRFNYDQHGILDRGHLRFFTRQSFRTMADEAGLVERREETVGMPVEVIARRVRNGRPPGRWAQAALRLDRAGRTLRPSLFAYQFLFELEPTAATD